MIDKDTSLESLSDWALDETINFQVDMLWWRMMLRGYLDDYPIERVQ